MKNHDFCENSVEVKFSQEIDFLGVQDLKIHLGPALRAMFKILAEPLVALTSGIVQEWYSVWFVVATPCAS